MKLPLSGNKICRLHEQGELNIDLNILQSLFYGHPNGTLISDSPVICYVITHIMAKFSNSTQVALKALLNNASLRAEASEKGLRLAARFHLDRIVDHLDDILLAIEARKAAQ